MNSLRMLRPVQGPFENQNAQDEAGNFGFDMGWTLSGTSGFAIGTWMVTAP